MKNTILLIISLMLCNVLVAQKFYGGVTLGGSFSQIDGDVQSGYKKIGMIGGVFVGYPIAQKLNAEAQLYYIGKGALNNIKRNDKTVYQDFKTSLHYLEMPILISWKVIEKLSIAGGLATGFLVADKLYEKEKLVAKEYYTMSNFDLSAIGKVEFYINKKISTSLQIAYSMSSIRKDYGWHNNNLGLAISYRLDK